MRSRRFPWLRVAFALFVCQVPAAAQTIVPPSLHYQATVTREGGLTFVTFETPRGAAELYLPADLVAGERFSGRLRGVTIDGIGYGFALEAAGQSMSSQDQQFTWRVPAPDASGGMAVILRRPDQPNAELARVHIPIVTQPPTTRPPLGYTSREFFVPPIGQSGAVFPIVGPFDGDSRHTVFIVRGMNAEILAETPRQALIRFPEGAAGPAPYVFTHDGVERTGTVRSVKIHTTYPASTGYRKLGTLAVIVEGLKGLSRDVGLRIENRTPLLADTGGASDFIVPEKVNGDGTFRLERTIMGSARTDRSVEIAVSLIIPKSAEEEIDLALQLPRRDGHRLPEDEHADVLRPYLPGVLAILADFLPSYFKSWDAYRTMVALDADAAAPLILNAIPSMAGWQSGGAAIYFYTDRAAADPALPYRQQVHDAAVRLLEDTDPGAPRSTCCENRTYAVRALGLLGSGADIPLLERFYRQPDVQLAAEASLARLGSASHIANIRAVLDEPLPKPFTRSDAHRIADALRSAGFSAQAALMPSVCRHLRTPGFSEGDAILEQPAGDAIDAVGKIVGHPVLFEEAARRCAAISK